MDSDPSRLAITGADGFIGWQLRCHLKHSHSAETCPVSRGEYNSLESLAKMLEPAETVFHLAGMNRGEDAEVYESNIGMARQLMGALDRAGIAPVIIFANSIHSQGETAFGRSKREAAHMLAEWARLRGARFVDVILPHVFGEGGRPFYNSAFATFCHQLAAGEEPQIHQDGEVELIHAQRVAARLVSLAQDEDAHGQVRIEGTRMRVSETLARLKRIHETYQGGVIPDVTEPLDLDFFNTYRSYLYPERYPVPLKLHADTRGQLFEAVKTHHGGQAFLSTTRPGITRGRHYHHHKVERFLVVSGQAEIRIRRLFDGKVRVFPVSGDAPCYIDIPTLHTHEIANVGSGDLLTLFWSHEIFDPAHPDTYPEPVIVEP